MWNSMYLIIVVLARASLQRAPVLSSIEIGPGIDEFKPMFNYVKKRQTITEHNKHYIDSKPSIALQDCPPCTCGVLGRKGRIIGGSPTYVNKYPWMALLMLDGNVTCGASLINNKYVITAAHCVYKKPKKIISIRLLEHDWNDIEESNPIDFNVLKVIKHIRYNNDTQDNDIALLRLDTDGVELGAYTGINPVCLPPEGKSFTGFMGIVTGWGLKKINGSMSEILREVRLPILSNDECRMYMGDVSNYMMCAGYSEGKKDACQGDSGGPLHINIDSIHYIAGVVSWGFGCGDAHSPGVYARVNKYLDWVAYHTRDACPCSKP